MPYFKSKKVVDGYQPIPESGVAGTVVALITDYDFVGAAAENDIVEISVLPPRHRLVNARVFASGTAAATAAYAVHLLAGTPGDEVVANRTPGSAILSSNALNAVGAAIEPKEVARGIGIVVGAGGVAAGALKLRIILEYVQE